MAYEILRTTQQYEALPYVLKKWGYYKLVLDEFEEAWVDKRDVYTHMQMQIISTAVLEVITIDEEYGYLKGTVKNISNEIIENVQVMVDFSTYNGDYIKSGMALITDTPLMPGKTSSFEIIVPPDQGVFSFVLRFKTLEGTLLPAYKETSCN